MSDINLAGAAAEKHLRDFGGRVLATVDIPANPKLPAWNGGVAAAIADPAAVAPAFSKQYRGKQPVTGYAYYPTSDIVIFDLDEKHGKSGSATIAHL